MISYSQQGVIKVNKIIYYGYVYTLGFFKTFLKISGIFKRDSPGGTLSLL